MYKLASRDIYKLDYSIIETLSSSLMLLYTWVCFFSNTWEIILQLKAYRIKSKERLYIRVNTRELNGVSKYNLSTLYTLGWWSMLY